MFVDARTLPEGGIVEAEICIIGAGAAGITLARDLAGGRRRVAVFESGGFDFSAETQELYEGEVVGQAFTPLVADRLRYFGGTTNHWSGSCRPFDASDFEGWPFGRDVLEAYYRGAQEVCQLGSFTYEPADWLTDDGARPLAFAAGARLRSGVFQNSPPTRFGTVYRQDLATADGVTVYLNANLVDIDTDENARSVSGLRVACLHGHRFQARAKYYVLAAGGIENPRLLLNANKVQKAGLGNGFDLVGRYFMDHADIPNAATILFTGPQPSLSFYDTRMVRGQSVQGYLHAAPEMGEEGMPPFCIGLQPGSLPDKDLAKESALTIYRSVMAGHVPDHLSFYLSRIMRGVEWKVADGYHRLVRSSPTLYSTFYTCGSPPDRESRVTLIDAVDALGLRRVKLDWRLPGDLERNMRRAHEVLAQELGRAGYGRLRINSSDTGYDPMKGLENAHHEMGTTRMHRDPQQGVVDENSRVHGIGNLFIAGSSVFPTYSFDDPTMTIVALALRLSDHLKTLLA